MVLSMSGFILKNREIPKNVQPIVDRMSGDGEKVLFVIVGDLALNGRYSESALIFAEDSVVCYDGVPGEEKRYFYRDMKDVISKRMYGNATLSAIMPNGRRVVFFRYTYSVASLCDAAALYINHINEGAERNEELAIMAITLPLEITKPMSRPHTRPIPMLTRYAKGALVTIPSRIIRHVLIALNARVAPMAISMPPISSTSSIPKDRTMI